MPQFAFPSPVGDLTLTEENGAIVSLDWGRGMELDGTALLHEARSQIDAYFDGKLTRFSLPLNPAGTDFQRRAWAALEAIPYGTVRSYGDLATELETAARAIGLACRTNPIPIVVPCHRVLAAKGLAGGYTAPGGLDTKAALLTLEGYSL